MSIASLTRPFACLFPLSWQVKLKGAGGESTEFRDCVVGPDDSEPDALLRYTFTEGEQIGELESITIATR